MHEDLRRALMAFLAVAPLVEPDVAEQCVQRAAEILWLIGPLPGRWWS